MAPPAVRRTRPSPAALAELGTLVRRRNIRRSVALNDLPQQFIDNVIPALAESVALERQLSPSSKRPLAPEPRPD
jgi:hypothetical protein